MHGSSKWRDGRAVALLFAVTIVLPSSALGLLAWRALDADRQLAEQVWRERQQDAARRLHSSMERRGLESRALAEALARGEDSGTPAPDQLIVILSPELRPLQPSLFAWLPDGRSPAEPQLPLPLHEAEIREQRSEDSRKAAAEYSALIGRGFGKWQGWLYLRLARALAKAEQHDAAAAALRVAAQLPDSPGPLSTSFAARFQLAQQSTSEAVRLYRDLCAGTWLFERSPYSFYEAHLRDISHLTRSPEQERREIMSRLLERVVSGESGWLTESGVSAQVITFARSRSVAVITLDRQWQAWLDAASGDIAQELAVRSGSVPASASAVSLASAGVPWWVWTAPRDPAASARVAETRRRLLLAVLLVIAGALVFGTVATVRILRRELRMAQLQSDFTATVSHEFRSPLTGIRQLAEMLLAGRAADDEARRRRYYQLICRESDRLTRLVENVLDISRIEDGRKQYRFERIATAEWLQSLAEVAEQRREIQAEFREPLPVVEGDREALSSAVLNLVDNAIKYSSEASPIRLGARGADGWVTIEVEDHGCGIPADERDRIFDRFYRGNSAGGAAKGVGLGLALVKHIADAHGARVRVESTPGEGSTFFLSLKAVL